MIHEDEYLYGTEVEVPKFDDYVIMRRIELLRDNLETLLEHSYHVRDTARVNAILKAIKFYEQIGDSQ